MRFLLHLCAKKLKATSVYVAVIPFAQININSLRHVLSLFDGFLVIFPGFVYTLGLYGQQGGL